MMNGIEWTATDSQTAALATATKAAVAAKRQNVVAVVASYSAAQVGLLTIKKGTTTVAEHYVHNAAVIEFPEVLRGDLGGAVSAELAAGAAGVVGKVVLFGRTEG